MISGTLYSFKDDSMRLLFTVLFWLIFSGVSIADMQVLSEEKMSHISGQAGLTVLMETRVLITADTIAVSDTDSDPVNWIRFNGFSVDDGNGQGFLVSNLDNGEPMMMDVGTTADGRTILALNLSPFANPISYHVQDVEFCSQSVGSLDLNSVELSPDATLWFSHHPDGSSGVEFDANLGLDIDSFDYTYNTLSEKLSVSGIHLAGSATGSPEDPAAWVMDGQLSVGDMDTNPATIDVGTDDSGTTHFIVGLPVSGSIRIEDVSMGGNSFGPMIIDDIRAHRLSITLSP